MSACSEKNPSAQAKHARQLLQALVDLLHEDVSEMTEPKAAALFETSAEVLKGLIQAFEHYENKSEPAWE